MGLPLSLFAIVVSPVTENINSSLLKICHHLSSQYIYPGRRAARALSHHAAHDRSMQCHIHKRRLATRRGVINKYITVVALDMAKMRVCALIFPA